MLGDVMQVKLHQVNLTQQTEAVRNCPIPFTDCTLSSSVARCLAVLKVIRTHLH
jgi:hypothetical protein